MLAAARGMRGKFDWRVGPARSLHLGFPDGSAVRVAQAAVVMEASGATRASQARRFAGILAEAKGWRCVGDDNWPLPEPEAPRIALAAAPAALTGFVGERLRRARLVMPHADPVRRQMTMALLRRTFGDGQWQSSISGNVDGREVILLIGPACARDIITDPTMFLHRAKALMRAHPETLVLNLSGPDAPASLRSLAALVREIEAELGSKALQGEARDAHVPEWARPSATDRITGEPDLEDGDLGDTPELW